MVWHARFSACRRTRRNEISAMYRRRNTFGRNHDITKMTCVSHAFPFADEILKPFYDCQSHSVFFLNHSVIFFSEARDRSELSSLGSKESNSSPFVERDETKGKKENLFELTHYRLVYITFEKTRARCKPSSDDRCRIFRLNTPTQTKMLLTWN